MITKENNDISYPNDSQIKAKLPGWATGVIILVTVTLWIVALILNKFWSLSKIVNFSGLTLNIIGTALTLAQVPNFGIFFDGGELEKKRGVAAWKSHRIGLVLIVTGFILQFISGILI